MNKKKVRKKSLNWHRHRYYHLKYEDIDYRCLSTMKKEESNEDKCHICWNCSNYHYYSCNSPNYPGYYDCGLNSLDSLDSHNSVRGHLIDFVYSLGYNIFNREPLNIKVINANEELKMQSLIKIPEMIYGKKNSNIEMRLYKHYNLLMNLPKTASKLESIIIDSLKKFVKNSDYYYLNKAISKKFKNSLGFYDFSYNFPYPQILLFAPFWVRNPYHWVPNKGEHLFNYLFNLYEPPKFWRNSSLILFYFSNYFDPDEDGDLDDLYKFILLSQGGSLKKAAKLFEWDIPAKLQYYLHKLNPELFYKSYTSFDTGSLMAEILLLNGSEVDVKRLIDRSFIRGLFRYKTNIYEVNNSSLNFFRDTAIWMINNSSKITDEESRLILNWVNHKYSEAKRRGTNFSLKRRKLNFVLKSSLEYDISCRTKKQIFQNKTWQAHNWNWVLNESSNNIWSFVELTSSEDLYQEGLNMKHCVNSYANSCVSGYSAIVSLRNNDKRCVTIEVNPRTTKIVQVKGLYNREANIQEQRVISQWIKVFSLK